MGNKKFVSFKEQMKKILIFYSLIPIIFTALIGYGMIYYLSYRAMVNNNNNNLKNLSQQTDEIISKVYNEIDRLSKDEILKKVILDDEINEKAYELLYKSPLNLEIDGKFVLYDKNINILMTNAEFLGSSNGYIWGLFYRMLSNNEKTINYVGKLYFREGNVSNFSVGKPIKNNNEIIGYLVCHMLDKNFEKIMGDSENFGVVLTDKYNNVISTNNANFKDSLDKLKKEFREKKNYLKYRGRKYYISKQEVFYSNIDVYCISSTEYIIDNFIESFIYITIVFIFLVIFMSKVAKNIALKKTKTIEEIIKAIKNIETGDLDTQINIKSNDEFEIIGDTYNQMLLDIKRLIEKNKEEATHSIVTEIKQLESQFNPHFLFNTLEMLRYTIHLDKKMANKIIINMASILRFSIENKSSEVKIEREIFYIKNYLEIQKIRFGDKFSYSIDVEERFLEYLTPKLIIQPIVENSIKHGYIQEKEFKILIKIKQKRERIQIGIFDNGKGIEKQELKLLKEKLLKRNLSLKEHIGMYNVQRRIELLYGKEYGLNIRSSSNRGTYIGIEIPFKLEWRQDDKSIDSRR